MISNNSQKTFTLPAIPKSFLTVDFHSFCDKKIKLVDSYPANSRPTYIVGARYLAHHPPKVKTKVELTLEFQESTSETFEPGDAFGIACQNPPLEVNWLLSRLNLEDQKDFHCIITLDKGATARQKAQVASLPHHSTPHILLSSSCEIRAVAKKVFIRCLAEYTEDKSEKESLLELCSREGAERYRREIQDNALNLLDILATHSSCHPPFALLLEHLPRLCPRYYSVASSPLVDQRRITLVFTLVLIPSKPYLPGATRYGVGTGWLTNLSAPLLTPSTESLEKIMSELSLQSSPPETQVWVYKKEGHSFALPQENMDPLILIGPGAGVAPFIGFLKHRQKLKELNSHITFGETWLFFGCRHKDFDYIYREELEKFAEDGIITHLVVAFSRDSDSECQYVQHAISKHMSQLLPLIVEKKAHIRVCGDALEMATGVLQVFHEGYQANTGCSPDEAKKYFATLRTESRYLQDIWA